MSKNSRVPPPVKISLISIKRDDFCEEEGRKEGDLEKISRDGRLVRNIFGSTDVAHWKNSLARIRDRGWGDPREKHPNPGPFFLPSRGCARPGKNR